MSCKRRQDKDETAKKLFRRAQEAEQCGKTAKALRLYKKSAKMGCIEAMRSLQKNYEELAGRIRDFNEKRRKQLQAQMARVKGKAKMLGYAVSLLDFSWIYQAVPYDFRPPKENARILRWKMQARKWEAKAAMWDARDAEALAEKYDEGEDTKWLGRVYGKNIPKAVRWYKMAATECPRSAKRLGEIYEKGETVKRDVDEAIIWYEKAEALLNGKDGGILFKAQNEEECGKIARALAWLYTEKGNAERVSYWIRRAEACEDAHDTILRQWFEKWNADFLSRCRKAAEDGDAEAMVALGEMYQRGDGVEQDEATAVAWYERAAAWDVLFDMYKNGDEVEQDTGKAIAYYEKGADHGDVSSMIALGEMYEEGNNVEPDGERAIAWYQKAAVMGGKYGSYALYKIGETYENGRIVEKNLDEAMRVYQQAAEEGALHAAERLSKIYEERGDAKSAAYWEKKEDINFHKYPFNKFPNPWQFEYHMAKAGAFSEDLTDFLEKEDKGSSKK